MFCPMFCRRYRNLLMSLRNINEDTFVLYNTCVVTIIYTYCLCLLLVKILRLNGKVKYARKRRDSYVLDPTLFFGWIIKSSNKVQNKSNQSDNFFKSRIAVEIRIEMISLSVHQISGQIDSTGWKLLTQSMVDKWWLYTKLNSMMCL